ncbi:competence type IV pilus ATPase ComGA [Companilactobacillus sp. DQM5]|uniref:competence type IV pilus ATPase ComGA n=1 Tax=Companilactobacillus sp. DQM5 TaxID=3463359 RepID=UPI004057E405
MEVQEFTENLFNRAILNFASDIFLIPIKSKIQISFKLSNSRKNFKEIDSDFGNKLINYLKFQGNMDISEKRRPQIGAFKYKETNVRLSSVGNYLGQEILVIRIIYKTKSSFQDISNFKSSLNKSGLILFSGPMGSGKTTSMYGLARELSKSKTVMCIEDPTEIHVDGFIQLQVNNDAKITYESLIKSSLRQRPDVLIIGEIRDKKTAELVIKAALSGYLVMSTVHAKSKYSVITRMLEFGVEKYSLKSVLNIISYQRLIPTIKNDLICVQDLLKENFEVSNEIDEFKDWRLLLDDLYKKNVINKKILEEYCYG